MQIKHDEHESANTVQKLKTVAYKIPADRLKNYDVDAAADCCR